MEAVPGHGRPRRDAGPQGPSARRGLRARAVGRLATAALGCAVALCAAAAPAWAADDAYCTGTSYGDEPAKAGPPIRFGIDPELAGTVGTGQGDAVPLDEAKDIAALKQVTPAGKAMVLRVNRLFWADGQKGIDRFKQIVARHDAAGFASEIQVRYHPAAEDEGNIEKWTAYVRHVVDEFAADRQVVAMTITNEVNLNISENTSDGAYDKAREALVQGIIAARDEADRRGRGDMQFGFTYAYRWQPGSDAAFWTELGQAPEAFRKALGFVGVDIYPGTFYPPALEPTTTAGHEMVVGLSTVRNCYMPKAKLGHAVPIWVTENGFQSGAQGDDASQAAALQDMIGKTIASAGTYNVTDYRWFNLRDNKTGGAGLFETTGMLHDDYTPKPAFAALRELMAEHGADAPKAARPCVTTLTVTLPRGTRRYVARLDGRRVPGRRSGRKLTITLRHGGKRRVVVVAERTNGRKRTLRYTLTACAPARAAAVRQTRKHTIVTLEFDVATADQAKALPLLEKYRFHATFFVNSGFVNHKGHLTWDQLRHMQAKGNEIAGQTIHHTYLTRVSNARLQHEVCDDRGRLLAQGLAADAFAYPYGAFDGRVRRVVIGCGYSSARLATGIAGAGRKCLRCPYAESIPPHNRYATRMPPAFQRTSKVSRITRAIRDAQRTGGGWVQILIHHVCVRCHRYAISPANLERLLLWLRARRGVEVRTVSQLMDIGGPTVRMARIGGGPSRAVGNFVTFHARPRSRRGVSRLRFFVDGRLIGVRHIAPYRLRWYTGRLTPGTHTVRVLLEDKRGNAAISPRQEFLKRVAAAPPPKPVPGQTGPP